MQLHVARLCLDCDEIHDAQICPICGSESFVYISRWIPAPERRTRPRTEPASPTAETYRELLTPDQGKSGTARWLRRGAVGVAALSVAGWMWRRNTGETSGEPNAPREPKARREPDKPGGPTS